MKIRIKIQSTLMFLGLAAIIFFSNSLFSHWKHKVLGGILDIAGIGFILFGFLFRISARGYKEERSYNGRILVKDGPYAIIRNPMYLGTFMIGIGIVIMLLEPWFFFLFTGIFLLIYIPQMRKEEEALLKRFGHEYKEYCKIVPKYFPRIDYLLRLNKYMSLKYFWVKKEIIPLITTVTIVILMEVWKYIRLLEYK